MAKISKSMVDALQPAAERLYVWDDSLRGFGVVVQPTGVKSFIFQYRTPERRIRRVTIGKVGTLTPEEARKVAKGLAADVANGGDPAGARKARREAWTVADMLDHYNGSAHVQGLAAASQESNHRLSLRHLKPLIGRTIADQLTHDGVKRVFADIAAGKTAQTQKMGPRGLSRVRGGQGAARMAIRLLRAAFNWAIREGLMERNPATGVRIGQDGTRDIVMTEADQYRRLFETLERMVLERRIMPTAADAIRVIALTGARTGEITGLRWRHVRLQDSELVIPTGEHKTGTTTGRPRIISLPAAAAAIVARQAGGTPESFVFPSSTGDRLKSLKKSWRAIRAEAGLPEGIGLHGLRHSFATLMAVQEANAAAIMETLGHRQLSTTTRYLNLAAARKAIVEKHAAPIVDALENRPKPDNVEPLTRERNR
jgi:integrase